MYIDYNNFAEKLTTGPNSYFRPKMLRQLFRNLCQLFEQTDWFHFWAIKGSNCSTAVEHTPVEQNS